LAATTQPLDDPAYGTASNKKIMVMLEFQNGEEQGLGVPLPKGTLRVYKNDVDGSTLLIGEDAIDHTPRTRRCDCTSATPLTSSASGSRPIFAWDYDERLDGRRELREITLRNHKKRTSRCAVVEHMFRWSECGSLESSHEPDKTRCPDHRIPRAGGGRWRKP